MKGREVDSCGEAGDQKKTEAWKKDRHLSRSNPRDQRIVLEQVKEDRNRVRCKEDNDDNK